MKVCIVCYGLRENNIRLQPWRYISEIACGLIRRNHDVIIITDGNSKKSYINGIHIIYLAKIKKIPFIPNKELISLITTEKPDAILWSIGPIDYLYMNTFKRVNLPLIGIFAGPLYKLSDITWIGMKELVENFRLLFVHIIYASLPSFFARDVINHSSFKKVLVMSQKNRHVLESMGAHKNKIVHIPVGIDPFDLIKPKETNSIVQKYGFDVTSFNILYFGSPSSIRGIDSLVSAFSKVIGQYPNVHLWILSRRREDELNKEETNVRNMILKLRIENNVKVISGFLDKNDVKKFITLCDVITLPFKIVPSDMPTSLLEAMAMGKVIISTNIDGIPELLGDNRGIVVEPYAEDELVQSIISCINNQNLVNAISIKSAEYMENYPTWDEISSIVLDEIVNIVNKNTLMRDYLE